MRIAHHSNKSKHEFATEGIILYLDEPFIKQPGGIETYVIRLDSNESYVFIDANKNCLRDLYNYLKDFFEGY
jgi:hypothetical protein